MSIRCGLNRACRAGRSAEQYDRSADHPDPENRDRNARKSPGRVVEATAGPDAARGMIVGGDDRTRIAPKLVRRTEGIVTIATHSGK